MLSFLEKYNKLPIELRDKVSSPEAMRAVADLEAKYDVDLAIAVMRVMVRDIGLYDLPKFFVFENELAESQAKALTEELKEKVFAGVADYLGLETALPAVAPVAAPAPVQTTPISASAIEDTWLKSKKAAAAERNSGFFFSSEDEEEVKNLNKKVDDVSGGGQSSDDIEKIVMATLTEAAINLSSEEMASRLKQVLRTYLRGVRNRVDTKQTLLKPVTGGGMGFDLNTVERVVFIADKKKKEAVVPAAVKMPARIKVPEDALASAGTTAAAGTPLLGRDVAYDFNQLKKPAENTPAAIKTADKLPQAEINPGLNAKPAGEAAVTAGEVKPPLPPLSNPVGGTGFIDLSGFNHDKAENTEETPFNAFKAKPVSQEPPALAADSNISFRRPVLPNTQTVQPNKVRMDDVKFVPKLTGPIDELREMDLVNFRRLSKDALSAIAKIKEKINFLEEENYAQRLAGIKAWRESPANRMYLTVGQESIGQGKPVSGIIAEMGASGQDYLTEQEFIAIMDLNKSLRF